MNNVKIITIDGPSGSGKGTISRILAKQLGFHYLDSGALYRLLGLVAVRHGIEISINADLTQLAKNMDVSFQAKSDGQNIVLLDKELSKVLGFNDQGQTVYDSVTTVVNSFEQDYFAISREYSNIFATLVIPGKEAYENALNEILLIAHPEFNL